MGPGIHLNHSVYLVQVEVCVYPGRREIYWPVCRILVCVSPGFQTRDRFTFLQASARQGKSAVSISGSQLYSLALSPGSREETARLGPWFPGGCSGGGLGMNST